MKRHATIFDIAKKLRISPSTVSRALSDHPDIKQETKERVHKAARALHYSPNPIAQSLKSNQTRTIGVIVPEIKTDFFSSVISGIEQIAYRSGYTILLCQSDEDFVREVINTNLLMQHRVAGLLVAVSQSTTSGDHFNEMLRRKIPVVFFDRARSDVAASKVIIDDHKAAFTAVNHVVERGYRRIAHLAGPQTLDICRERQRGYLDALSSHGILPREEFVHYGGMGVMDGYRSMDRALANQTIPDAIFAVNDNVAIGAYRRIKESGMRIPQDIAIMGFGDTVATSLVEPAISTIDQPSLEMGKQAAMILIDTIEQKTTDLKTLILETKLLVREST